MRVLDKLSQFNRPITSIKLLSSDETQEIEVFYQCLTMLNDRILRKAMQEEFEEAVGRFKELKPGEREGSLTLYDKWMKQFEEAGKEKCASFIVASDRNTFRTETIKEMDKPPLLAGATKEEEEAWVAEFSPIFERITKEAVADLVDTETLESLAEKCVDIQIDIEANKKAFETYRLRLIKESIFEKADDSDKYIPVFDNIDQIEEALASSTIEMLADRIYAEVREASNTPLKRASTN